MHSDESNTMTAYEVRSIESAIADTARFIDREEARNPALRPAAVAELLARYKLHLAKLQAMLEAA